MSVIDGFGIYNKLHEIEKKVLQDLIPSNDFRVYFMTAIRINYPDASKFGEECYVCKEIQKMDFVKHVYSLIY